MKHGLVVIACGTICLLSGMTGCGTKETQPPVVVSKDRPAPPKVEPEPVKPTPKVEDDIGAVKFETALKDPKTVVLVDGSEYRLAELDKELKLKPGEHRLEVRLGDRVIQKHAFTLAKGQRLIVELYDPERRAAEWALQLGGAVDVVTDSGRDVKVPKGKALPGELFRVKAIRLQDTKPTAQGLNNLKDLEAITELQLAHTQTGDAAMEHLKDLKSLKILGLAGAPLTDAGVVHLKDLTALETLDLNGARITDEGLAHLKRLANLQTLGLEYVRLITDDGLRHLKDMRNLKRLVLNVTPVTGAGYSHLHGLPLAELLISRSAVNGAGLKNLHGFKNLKYLSLWATKQITDDSLAQLQGLNVETLDIGSTQISGPGLAALKDVGGLKVLDLKGTPLTDAALPHLKALSGLTSLRLGNTKLSDAAKDELQKALAKTKIVR